MKKETPVLFLAFAIMKLTCHAESPVPSFTNVSAASFDVVRE